MGHEICIRSNDATLGSAGDSPPHLGEYFLGRLVIPLPSVHLPRRFSLFRYILYSLLVSFIFIHLIKYKTTYISLQALFSLAYFDRSFLSSPKCPLKYFRKEVFCLATQHFGRFLLDGITFWTGVCFSMLSVISSGTIQYFNLLSSLSQNENHCSTL